MKNYKYLTLVIILVASAALRFYNLMHDYPYFFNPDERNMASAITRFRLPANVTQIPICLISQFSPIFTDNRSLTTDNCSLNPHFFAYGQFPLYLAYASDVLTRPGLAVLQGLALNNLSTDFPSAIYWLRFWSAFSSILTVLFVYLISRKLLTFNFALLTATLVAFSPGLIQAAHFGTTESLLTFFFMASVYLSISYLGNLGHLSNLKFIVFTSLAIGLSLGSKLTGVFFFVPPLISLIIRKTSPGRSRVATPSRWPNGLLEGGFILIGSILFFVLSSPYNWVEPENFQSAVFGYEADVAMGKYEAFYTRQFVDSLPILFQVEKIFPFVLGWPVFILGTLGLFIIFVRSFRAKGEKSRSVLRFEGGIDIILISSFWIYFIPNAFLFAKWTRFMTPVLPFFTIFTAYAVQQIYKLLAALIVKSKNSKFKIQNYKSKVKIISLFNFKLYFYIFTFSFLISAILPGIAFMSIYTHEDTRVTASKWIYENIPDNSYILSETANVVDIPLGLPTSDQRPKTNDYTVISFDFYHLDENPILFEELTTHLEKADYILIPSRRIFANYPKLPQKYPLAARYYELLFSGKLGFEKVKEISVLPDEQAEETFTVFDHPVIRIYRKIKPLNKEEYHSLLKV